jgi:hypothetical protein
VASPAAAEAVRMASKGMWSGMGFLQAFVLANNMQIYLYVK